MDWIKRFVSPGTTKLSHREKILSALAAFTCIFLLGTLTWHLTGTKGMPFMLASIGATAVLIFVVPSSPMSQPWPIFGGHTISVFIGVCVHQLVNDTVIAAAMAVSLSIIAMHYARCLHPPGGAATLGVVLGGPEIQAMGFSYIAFPVAINALLMIVLGMLINRVLLKRDYPAALPEKTSLSHVASEWALGPPRFKNDDLQAALQQMNSYVDVSQQDLARIYTLAVMHANKRRIGDVRCRDIMSSDPLTLRFDDELESAWNALQQKNTKAAPVVDGFHRPIGIVTITDFVRHATDYNGASLQEKIKNFLRRTHGMTSDKPEVVGQIMSNTVQTASVDQHIIDLIPVFTEKGFHHMPVIDEQGKITGIITRADVMRSMLIVRS